MKGRAVIIQDKNFISSKIEIKHLKKKDNTSKYL